MTSALCARWWDSRSSASRDGRPGSGRPGHRARRRLEWWRSNCSRRPAERNARAKVLALEVIAHVRQAYPEIELREVDLVKHPEVAVKYGVLSTPALIINGELAWEGVPSVQKL